MKMRKMKKKKSRLFKMMKVVDEVQKNAIDNPT